MDTMNTPEPLTPEQDLKAALAECKEAMEPFAWQHEHGDEPSETDFKRLWSAYMALPSSIETLTALLAENDRLKGIIAKHDLCHDLHGMVGRDEFEEGCRRETVKEFGSCGWAEEQGKLRGENDRLRAEVERHVEALKRHCQCRFANGEQYEECHLHQCQRSVCENGDPTDETLEQRIGALEAEVERLKRESLAAARERGCAYSRIDTLEGEMKEAHALNVEMKGLVDTACNERDAALAAVEAARREEREIYDCPVCGKADCADFADMLASRTPDEPDAVKGGPET